MFGTNRRTLARIETLSQQLATLSGEVAAKSELLGLANEYEQAKKQVVDMELKMATLTEEHERQIREVEHKIGLHKIQTEHDVKAARKEAELAVREEGLNAQKDQFKDQMEFMSKRMENEIESQRDLMEKILSRLPNFERSHTTVEHIGVQPTVQITDGK